MKEAAGEANMTVITIVLIGVVLLIGTVVVTRLMNRVSTTSQNETGACASGYHFDETTATCVQDTPAS
ncbi:MAG: hypothetical protein Q4E75_03960 [bacterium]|nr:hypothetical protein [bacterium]